MTCANRIFRALGLAIAILLTWTGKPALSDQGIIVVRSTIAEIPPGTVFKLEETLTLPDGSEIQYIDKSGKVSVLRGPFEGSVPAALAASQGEASQEKNSLEKTLDLMNQTTGTEAGASR